MDWLKELLKAQGLTEAQINAIVEKTSDGEWKVTDFGVQGVGSC